MAHSKFSNTNLLRVIRTPEFCINVTKNLLGHKVSKQTRDRISKSLVGQKQSQVTINKRTKKLYRKVRLKTFDGNILLFDSILSAAKTTGLSRCYISSCCNKRNRSKDGICSLGKWSFQ